MRKSEFNSRDLVKIQGYWPIVGEEHEDVFSKDEKTFYTVSVLGKT